MKKLTKVLLLVGLVLTLGACSKKSENKSELNVVTTTDSYSGVAKAVLGNHGKVTPVINNPNVDPHDFEPTTKTAKLVSESDLTLRNGLGYDGWANKLKAKEYIDVAKVNNKKDGENEHLWYSIPVMRNLSDALAERFAKMQPEHKAEFKENAKKYQEKLAKLENQLNEIKKNSDGKSVAVSEPVFNYALQSMGYKVSDEHFAKAIEEGDDPSYSDIKQLQDDIKAKKIAFFVENIQSEGKAVNNIVKLCKENNIPVIKVTETKPKDKDYFQWMESEFKQVQDTQK